MILMTTDTAESIFRRLLASNVECQESTVCELRCWEQVDTLTRMVTYTVLHRSSIGLAQRIWRFDQVLASRSQADFSVEVLRLILEWIRAIHQHEQGNGFWTKDAPPAGWAAGDQWEVAWRNE